MILLSLFFLIEFCTIDRSYNGQIDYIVGRNDSISICTRSEDFLQTLKDHKTDLDLYEELDSILVNYHNKNKIFISEGDTLYVPIVSLKELPKDRSEAILYLTFTNALHYLLESHKAQVFINNKRIKYYFINENGTVYFYAGKKFFLSGKSLFMIKQMMDTNKDIMKVGYNLRNSPIFIQFSDGSQTEYVYSANGALEQTTHYYPFGAVYADAGLCPDFQKYKYTGKELDLVHGLNTYDHGARQNYSILGVWDRVDPLAEKYYNVSPYNVCGDNPIKIIDPNVLGWIKEHNGNVYWDKDINSQEDANYSSSQLSYIGQTANFFNKDGDYQYGNENGKLSASYPLEEVVVKGDKDYKKHHSVGYYLFGDIGHSDDGYGPWNPDKIYIGTTFHATALFVNLSFDFGLAFTPGTLSLYGDLSGGISPSFINMELGGTIGFEEKNASESNTSISLPLVEGVSFSLNGNSENGNVDINSGNITFGVKTFISQTGKSILTNSSIKFINLKTDKIIFQMK